MVLGADSGSGSESNSNELINVLTVGEVLVEVILEVLNHVHVLLDEIVSSDLLEWESFIVKLIGRNGSSWVLSLLLKGGVDLHGVRVVDLIESSGELGELELHLFLGFLEREWASGSEDLVVKDLVRVGVSGEAFGGVNHGGGDGGKSNNSEGESHLL